MGIFPFLGQNCVEIKTKYLLSCKKEPRTLRRRYQLFLGSKGEQTISSV